MSVFIKIIRFGSALRLLQVRALCAHIGEDARGILGCSAAGQPFFSLHANDSGWLLSSERSDLNLNGQRLARGTEHQLAPGDTLLAADYTFSFHFTSPLAELLAPARPCLAQIRACLVDDANLPVLSYQLGGLRRCFPLVPQFETNIGSSPNANIMINLDGIEPLHAAVLNREDSVWIKPLKGRIAVNGRELKNMGTINQSARLSLLPGGVDVFIGMK